MNLRICTKAVLLLLGAVFRADSQSTAVTGVKDGLRGGPVPLRKSIDDLQAAGGAQWDLYIQALRAMYDQDSNDPLSFFQIAGTHGRPYIEWGNTGAQNSTGWAGYCPHGEKLFLPWHRPLLVLYEQTLVAHAKTIAATYPKRYKHTYTKAAESLRVPYWDWAAEPKVPQATVPETITVNTPGSESLRQTAFKNPLARFEFPKDVLNGKYGFFDDQNRTETYRCRQPESYPSSANSKLAARPYKQWTYDTFTRSRNFSEFGSTSGGGMSLEAIHNGIHWDGACGEQFLNAEYSAFDPLFMLHHANVDRLWAYWQAMQPDDASFEVPYKGQPRFATPEGTVIDSRSPLQPFLQQDGEFHTPESVKSIQSFGYSYVGLEYWQKTPLQMRQDATELVNSLYAPAAYADATRLAKAQREAATTRYFAHVSVEVSELQRPCVVELRIANVYAASMFVMSQPRKGIMTAVISVDDAVNTTATTYNVQVSNEVLGLIKSQLQSKIYKLDGTTIPMESVPSLHVDLEDVMVTPPRKQSELPAFTTPRLRTRDSGRRASLGEI